MRELVAYKILRPEELAALERDGSFAGSPADLEDGFVHLSSADQVAGTIERHFAGAADLCVAAIDIDGLRDKIRWEAAKNGEDYPHLYAPLSLASVIAYGPVERNDDGSMKLPVAG